MSSDGSVGIHSIMWKVEGPELACFPREVLEAAHGSGASHVHLVASVLGHNDVPLASDACRRPNLEKDVLATGAVAVQDHWRGTEK